MTTRPTPISDGMCHAHTVVTSSTTGTARRYALRLDCDSATCAQIRDRAIHGEPEDYDTESSAQED